MSLSASVSLWLCCRAARRTGSQDVVLRGLHTATVTDIPELQSEGHYKNLVLGAGWLGLDSC